MFSYNTKVGYSKVNRKSIVPDYEIINYLQDCATFHADEMGFGLKQLQENRKAWVLISYRIKMYKPIYYGQEIEIGTSPTGFRKIFASRQLFIKDSAGEYLVKADSIWILMDLNRRKTIRIPEDYQSVYTTEQIFDDFTAARKITLSEEKEMQTPIPVVSSYIDTNGHMNNADYVRVAEELIPEDAAFTQMEIVYHKEAMRGDMLVPYLHREKDGVSVSFKNDKKELLTEIKYTK